MMGYKARYKSNANMDYLNPIRVVEMLYMAIDKSGTTEPTKVAYALEDLHYAGPSGDSWMRGGDHQMMGPTYVLRLAKAGQAGVRHDVDGTGLGWRTEELFDVAATTPQLRCQMERPPR